MRVDIHDYKGRLKQLFRAIRNSKILKSNQKILFQYYHACIAEGLSIGRIEKCLRHLYKIALMLNKPFTKCKKEDIVKIVEWIEQSKYSEWTKHDYKAVLKKFFRWLRKSEEYPEEVKWIKNSKAKKNRLPEEILTEEEIKQMAERAENLRDKAFVLVLYESGARIGEILPLKIKNVYFDRYGAVLLINGKTGQRRVRIIASAPALAKWLEIHPFREKLEAWVWIDLGNRNKYNLMSYPAILKMLRKLARKAGIRKRVNPHSFRHARATHLAKHLTEAQLKQYFGWSQSSEMASIYVHLSGRDVDDALLRLQGLKEERREEEEMKIKICPRCKEKNDPLAKFCRRCGSPLDFKFALDLEEKRREKDEIVAKVIERIIEKLNLEKVVYETIRELKLEKEFERA